MKHKGQIKLVALSWAILASIVISSPAMAVIEVGAFFGGAAYTNLGKNFTLTLSATTKGNNSKKQSCGRTYVNINAANMRIIDAKIGDIPNSTLEKSTDGSYIISTPSKYDCIPDGTHLVATFTAETIITGDASIFSNNGTAMIANISTPLQARIVTVYSDVCPAGKTGIPPDCKVMDDLKDVCPNIGGAQTVVPVGMKKDDSGKCVTLDGEDPGNIEQDSFSYQFKNLKLQEIDNSGSIGEVTYISFIDSVLLRWDIIKTLSEIKVEYSEPGKTRKTTANQPEIDNLSASLMISNLEVFTDYKIIITGKNSLGEVARYTGVAKTRGYPIEVIVRQTGDVRSGAKVTIAGVSTNTDSYGSTEFESASGQVSVDVQIGEIKETHVIDVKKALVNEATGVRETQEFTLEIESPQTIPLWVYVLITCSLAIIGSVLGFIVYKKNRRKHLRDVPESQNVGIVSAPTPLDSQNQ